MGIIGISIGIASLGRAGNFELMFENHVGHCKLSTAVTEAAY
jgi:hypothetical protein